MNDFGDIYSENKNSKVMIFNVENEINGYLTHIQYFPFVWILCSRMNAEIGEYVALQHKGVIKANGVVTEYHNFIFDEELLDD